MGVKIPAKPEGSEVKSAEVEKPETSDQKLDKKPKYERLRKKQANQIEGGNIKRSYIYHIKVYLFSIFKQDKNKLKMKKSKS